MFRIGVALSVCLAALAVAPVALSHRSSGAGSIASASALPVGHTVSGGGTMSDSWYRPNSGAEFWRVAVPAGGVFVADIESTNGEYVKAYVLRPTVTDFTLDNAQSIADDGTSGKTEMRFRAAVSGNYILVLFGDNCCDSDFGYQLTSNVETRTAVSVRGPAKVRRGGYITVSGHVDGLTEGNVSLQYKNGGSWRTYATAYLGSSGGFTYKQAFNGRCNDLVSVRAIYGGDDAHPSGTSNTVNTRLVC
jgi:hypothetical protein